MKLKRLKDLLKENDDNYTVDMLQSMIKEWINFLEKEALKNYTKYPQGKFQADILREIFNCEE